MSNHHIENSDYGRFAVRVIRGMARRAAGDPELLPALRDIAELVDGQMRVAVAQCRREGYSWAEIAERLGTSRQAAQQRYGRLSA